MSVDKLASHSSTPLNDRESALFDISERVLAQAKIAGASAIDMSLNQLSGAEYSVRNGQPETIERNQDKSLDIRVFMGTQTGSASTTDFSQAAIESTVNAAATIAKVTQGDPCLKLADASLYPTDFIDLNLHHPNTHNPEALAQFALNQALSCEASALRADKRITNSEGASFSAHEGVSLMRNSNGFTGFSRSTRYGLSCSVIAGTDDGMQRDYWYDSQRNLESLEPAESIGQIAAKRTVDRLNAQKISTRRSPVVFDANIAPGLLGHLVSAISGGAIYKKASFLTDKIEQQLFPKHIDILQTPHLEGGMGSALYDSDGVATKNLAYVKDGRLRSYVLSLYSACKLKLKTTGNAGGVRNLSVTHEDITQNELLHRMGTGLLVTELMGFGVNIVTGDYSRGAAGFWVENGEIQYPVHEITLSGQLQNMFRGFSGISNDTNRRGNVSSGSILIDELTIGGS